MFCCGRSVLEQVLSSHMSGLREELRQELRNLHVDMLRQFHSLQVCYLVYEYGSGNHSCYSARCNQFVEANGWHIQPSVQLLRELRQCSLETMFGIQPMGQQQPTKYARGSGTPDHTTCSQLGWCRFVVGIYRSQNLQDKGATPLEQRTA